MDPICQIRFHRKCAMERDCPLCALTHTPSYPLIYALITHRHTPTNNRVCGQWGPHGLRSSLGEHRGISSNGNKKHTHTPPPFVVRRCPVCNEGIACGTSRGGEGELCFRAALGRSWTCTGMIVGSSHWPEGAQWSLYHMWPELGMNPTLLQLNQSHTAHAVRKESVHLYVFVFIIAARQKYGSELNFNESLALWNCYKLSLVNIEMNWHRGKIMYMFKSVSGYYIKCISDLWLKCYASRNSNSEEEDRPWWLNENSVIFTADWCWKKDNVAIHQCRWELILAYDNELTHEYDNCCF